VGKIRGVLENGWLAGDDDDVGKEGVVNVY
jgi:hypothetical protein